MSDFSDIQAKVAGTMGLDEGGETVTSELYGFTKEYTKAAIDTNAADTTAATKVWCNGFNYPVRIIGAKYSPGGTLTANNTNYATLAIATDDGADSSPATGMTAVTDATATGTGNWATDVAENFSVSNAANLAVASGANVFFSIAKAGSGVQVPAGMLIIKFAKI